ncbi:RecX family transcriptional regulator, partial [Bacillaceae bacterium Marseille-Q3522]|nr:RecX family transcriptional regulator [Bacillaceae bacterium Marseille-Q3522]
IFISDEFAFSIDEEVLIKFNLKKGSVLDEFTLSEIGYYDEIAKAYQSALRNLTSRMRSEGEIQKYLAKKQFEEAIIKEAILKLKGVNLLDDKKFTIAYVRTQLQTTDKGPDVIRYELQEKGITEQLIESSLMEYPLSLQFEKANNICEKYRNKNKLESHNMFIQKCEQLLIRKGYPYSLIQEIKESNLKKIEKADEMEAVRFHGEKAKKKYNRFSDFEYEQKMKAALYRKGFSLDIIEQYLAEEN